MDRKEFLEQKFQKELQARKEGRCWVHGDKLLQSITEPFEGYPSKTIREIDTVISFPCFVRTCGLYAFSF